MSRQPGMPRDELAAGRVAVAPKQHDPAAGLFRQFRQGGVQHRLNQIAVRAEMADKRAALRVTRADVRRCPVLVRNRDQARNGKPHDRRAGARHRTDA